VVSRFDPPERQLRPRRRAVLAVSVKFVAIAVQAAYASVKIVAARFAIAKVARDTFHATREEVVQFLSRFLPGI